MSTSTTSPHGQRAPSRAPGLLLGLGLGGFVDGILLHQILQWHHMVSDTAANPPKTVAGLEANTLGDGLFHLATWFFVAAAMLLTIRSWQAGRLAPPWRAHGGMLLAGWGTFNLVEGLIDHQLLGIHHVRDDLGAPVGWDLAFLASGALMGARLGAAAIPARLVEPLGERAPAIAALTQQLVAVRA